MKIRYAIILVAFLCFPVHAQTGEMLVATRQIKMKTGKLMFKFPVEAQRGERWEIIKKEKNKATVTFAPGDPRRAEADSVKMTLKYDVEGDEFKAFVTETAWPSRRRALAEPLFEVIRKFSRNYLITRLDNPERS